jgi:hypothetical protein
MIRIIDAIMAINSTAKVVVRGTDIDACEIEWHNGTTEITKENIKAKIAELEIEYNNNQYQRDREVAYPSIADQLDMQYHDKKDGTTTWEDAIAKVKTDNPKE